MSSQAGNEPRSGDEEPRPVQAPAIPAWQVGARVFAPWGRGWLYPATVGEVQGESLYLCYDDGDHGWVPAAQVRPLDVTEGSRVYCRWQGGDTYYPGTVTTRQGDQLHIHYDDGDRDWSPIGMIRVPSEDGPGSPQGWSRWGRAVVWPALCLLAGGLGLYLLIDEIGLSLDAEQAVATVETYKGGRRLTSPGRAQVRYEVEGKPARANVQVWLRSLQPGSQVPILYRPSSPHVAHLDSIWQRFWAPLVLAAVGAYGLFRIMRLLSGRAGSAPVAAEKTGRPDHGMA
jgi:hypothetical protein